MRCLLDAFLARRRMISWNQCQMENTSKSNHWWVCKAEVWRNGKHTNSYPDILWRSSVFIYVTTGLPIGFVAQSSLSLEECVTGHDAISLFCEARYVSKCWGELVVCLDRKSQKVNNRPERGTNMVQIGKDWHRSKKCILKIDF